MLAMKSVVKSTYADPRSQRQHLFLGPPAAMSIIKLSHYRPGMLGALTRRKTAALRSY